MLLDVLSMPAVVGDDPGVIVQRVTACDPQVQRVVGCGVHARVETAGAFERFAPEHRHPRHPDVVLLEQLPVMIAFDALLLGRRRLNRAVTRHSATAPINHRGPRVRCQRRHADVEGSGRQHVVGVEKHDESPTALLEAAIPRHGHPKILLPDARRPRKRSRDRTGIVVRAVVDDDDLDVRMFGLVHARDRVTQKVRMVVAGDDDGNERFHG